MLRGLLLAFVVVMLASCGSTPQGKSEAEIAGGLAAQQRYGDALAAIDQAILKEPRNGGYKALRAQYAADLSKSVKMEVASILAGGVSKESFDKASRLIAEATAKGVDAASLATVATRVDSAREGFYAGLEGDYRAAVQAMESEQWLEAYKLLGEVTAVFPNYEDAGQRLARVRQQAGKIYLGEAGRALKQEDLVAARSAVNKLLMMDPQNNIARNMLGRISERDNKDYYVAKMAEARQAGDTIGIARYCKAVLRYDTDDNICQQLLASQSRQLAQKLADDANLAMSEGRLVDATKSYSQLVGMEDNGSLGSLAALKGNLAKHLFKQADNASQDGQPGLAWVLLEKLRTVDSGFSELGELQRAMEDSIEARSRKGIAVFRFESPSETADAGVILRNNLEARLFDNAGRDISILERQKLTTILDEMNLGQIGVVSPDSAKDMGLVLGVDYAVMGSVLLYKVDTTETKSSRTVRYKVGETIEDNIDFLNWRAIHPNPSKKDLAGAPPAKIKVDSFQTTEYDVAEIKKVGFLSLAYRIVDLSTGVTTGGDTIERKKPTRDTGNEGLPDAGIAYDPMEIATDTEILQQLTDEVVDELSIDVLRPLQSLEKTYFDQGEEFERRGEALKALESYVDSIFNEKIKSVSASPLTAESLARIDRLVHAHSFEN
ncbi:MAG: tetratricopeptide (TPR) repeat protein [Halieaceae bacterium]|jgi:tetratricopeptide (TPR) repeat protein